MVGVVLVASAGGLGGSKKDRVWRPAASGPARPRRPIPATTPQSPAGPTGLPAGDVEALCFIIASRTGDETEARGGEAVEAAPDHVDTVGQRSAILRAVQPCRRRAAPTARAARVKREASR